MAYNVSSLTDYVIQTQDDLMAKTVLGARSMKYLNVLQGIKSSESLNTFDNTFTFQDGTGCGFNANGTVSFAQRNLVVKEIVVQEELCPKNLNAKYTQYQLKPGNTLNMPFEQQFTDNLTAQLAAKLETAVWQGDTFTGNTNADTNKFDGLIKIISGTSGSYVTGNTYGITAITQSNVISAITGVYMAIPFTILDKDDLTIFVGMDVYRLYVQALLNASGTGNFHIDPTMNADYKMFIPATNTKLVGLPGLNSSVPSVGGAIIGASIIAARSINLYFGTDNVSEEDKIEIWGSQDNRTVRLNVDFKAGTQVKLPTEVVYFH